MGFLLKLVWRDFIRHRSMLAFALAAIAATCCLIVWFIASIDVASLADDNGSKDYLGVYSLALCTDGNLSEEITDAIEDMDEATRICYGWQGPQTMILEEFDPALVPNGMGDRRSPMLLGIGDKETPLELAEGRWFANSMECVLGAPAEAILTASPDGSPSSRKIKISDKIRIKNSNGEFELTVVGKLKQKPLIKQETHNRGGNTFSFGFGLGIGGKQMGAPQAPAPARQPAPPTPAGPAAAQSNAPSQPGTQPQRGPFPGPGGPGGMRGPRSGRFGRQPIDPTAPSVYVSLTDAGAISGDDETVNLAFVQLKEGFKEEAFYKKLEVECGAPLESLRIRKKDTLPVKAENEELGGANADKAIIGQAWSTIGIVILASVFIIFTTLSMGVSAKIRQLAMLRTVGFTKGQIAAFILLEGLVLGLLGWLGGLVSGWLLLTLLIGLRTGVVPIVSLTWQCMVFALCCSLAGALLASIVPAIRATRVSPTESMVRKGWRLSGKQLLIGGLLGLLLLALIPVLIFWLPLDVKTRIKLFTTLGTFCLGAGFLLFFPWTIVFTEKILGPILAKLFGFHPHFLTNILTSNQWRTFGTTIALSIGLGLFTSIHIWSSSMLNMFRVPTTVPDVLVRFQEGAISEETTATARSFPSILPDTFMRVSVAQPNMDASLRQKMAEAHAMGSNIVMMGIDAEMAWRDKSPRIRLKFIEGSRQKAFEAFSQPNARVCVIPETLSVHGKLHIGDTIRLAKSATRPRDMRGPMVPQPQQDESTIDYAEYTVVGVVDFAWVWMSKCAGVRVSSGRTAGLVFTPYQPLIEDFGALDQEFFWFDTVKGTRYTDIVDYMRVVALDAAQANPDARRANSFAGGTRWDSGINRNFVIVSSNESLNNSLMFRATGVIKTMTQMPLIILLLSTIAVINTMVVSVRSRRWEMGILRACGVTRWGLVRMILAEALLIGLCACVLSFCFGLFYAWVATSMVTLAPMFGVIAPPLTIPWGPLAHGFALAIGVCALAGIWPALAAGLTETAKLLQNKE
ncbi:MAG: FtsX-like permease family protein [Victivallales bacterium]|nr:FtsX-like permease family protein [Victivallales bacterium]